LNKSLESVKYLLEQWAEHHRKYGNILGYGSDTVESRLMEYGGVTSGSAIRTIPSYRPNKQVKDTDHAIQALTRYYQDMVKHKYIEQRPEDELFVLANLGRTKYYTEINVIYTHVGAWLHIDMR